MHGQKNVKSECEILIAFPRQQWFRETVTALRHTYVACLVAKSLFIYSTSLPFDAARCDPTDSVFT
jgi:hypothetical protein